MNAVDLEVNAAPVESRARAIVEELVADPALLVAVVQDPALLAAVNAAVKRASAPRVAFDRRVPVQASETVQRYTLPKLTPASPAALMRARLEESRRAKEALVVRAARCEVPIEDAVRGPALLDDLPEGEALALCRKAARWWQSGRAGRKGCLLALAGLRGRGKTVAACHVMLRQQDDGIFAMAARIATTPRNGWPENRERWERWTSAPVMVLDDLGTEPTSGGDHTLVTDLLFDRYSSGLLTIAPHNLTEAAFQKRYLCGEVGDRLAHRLAFVQGDEMPWFAEVKGPNLRDALVRQRFVEERRAR